MEDSDEGRERSGDGVWKGESPLYMDLIKALSGVSSFLGLLAIGPGHIQQGQ